MKLKKTRSTYALTGIGVKEFQALERAEQDWDKDIAEQLENRHSVEDVEYNGHFGDNIFYSVYAEDDTPELHEDVERTVKWAIVRATKKRN